MCKIFREISRKPPNSRTCERKAGNDATRDTSRRIKRTTFRISMPSFPAKCALFALVGFFALVEPAHAAASDGVCEYLLTAKACAALKTSATCGADTRCEWPTIYSPGECFVKGDYTDDEIYFAALDKTDSVSVEYKTKTLACEAVTQRLSCSSANDCAWSSTAAECSLSDTYSEAVVTKCAASSASASFVAFQALVAAAAAAALLA